MWTQVASSLFLVNSALALILLPYDNGKEVGDEAAASAAAARKKTDGDCGVDDGVDDGVTPVLSAAAASSSCSFSENGETQKSAARAAKQQVAEAGSTGGGVSLSLAASRFWKNFKKACNSGPTLRILAALLIYGFFMRSLDPRSFVG